MNEEIEKITRNMLFIIIKYGDDFDELEENEIRYQLPYKQMEKLYDYITNLQEENQKLNKIIDELEKWLNEKEHYYSNTDCQKEAKYEFLRISNEYTKTLNKLIELKKGE